MENINNLLNSTKELYNDINKNINDLVNSRITKNIDKEHIILFNMETLMCQTLQQLDCIITYLESDKKN
jgi:hypothetical protein